MSLQQGINCHRLERFARTSCIMRSGTLPHPKEDQPGEESFFAEADSWWLTWDCRESNYSAESVFAQAVPPRLNRMTPDWSEQNARWPLWPFTLGTASDVYVTAGAPVPAV